MRSFSILLLTAATAAAAAGDLVDRQGAVVEENRAGLQPEPVRRGFLVSHVPACGTPSNVYHDLCVLTSGRQSAPARNDSKPIGGTIDSPSLGDQVPSDQAYLDAASRITPDDVAQMGTEERGIVHRALAIAQCRIGTRDFLERHALGQSLADMPPVEVPAAIADPLIAVSQALGVEPGVSYDNLVQNNCRARSAGVLPGVATGPADWQIQSTMTHPLDGQGTEAEGVHNDERGFYAAHCNVENVFAPAFEAGIEMDQLAMQILAGADSSSAGELRVAVQRLLEHLSTFGDSLRHADLQLKRMPTFISPRRFLSRLRPYVKCGEGEQRGFIFRTAHSRRDERIDLGNGRARLVPMVPDGEEPRPSDVAAMRGAGRSLRGPTGAQTGLIAFADAVIGVRTAMEADDDLNTTMTEFTGFHPASQRETIARLQENDGVGRVARWCHERSRNAEQAGGDDANDRLAADCAELVQTYDLVVEAIAQFRISHVGEVVTPYIVHATEGPSLDQSPKIEQLDGTGGTALSTYLCHGAVGTLMSRLGRSPLHVPSLPHLCALQCEIDMARPVVEDAEGGTSSTAFSTTEVSAMGTAGAELGLGGITRRQRELLTPCLAHQRLLHRFETVLALRRAAALSQCPKAKRLLAPER